ncbi:hypothetical protein C8Q76DRAFT_701884 [Earliella scabrosa]|nr:hypothetical protein C8Q76DRAFT_701884 [Earliella scabrosa]
MGMNDLAPELFLHILSILESDRAAFSSAALVCKTWRDAARPHLFESITIKCPEDFTAFSDHVLDSNAEGIAPYVKHLTLAGVITEHNIVGLTLAPEALTSVLVKFPALQHLTLDHFRLRVPYGAPARTYLRTPLQRLDISCFYHGSMPQTALATLHTFFSLFTIDTLTVNEVVFKKDGAFEADIARFARSLSVRKLVITNLASCATEMLDVLAPLLLPAALKEIRVTCTKWVVFSCGLCRFLRQVGSRIARLHLDLSAMVAMAPWWPSLPLPPSRWHVLGVAIASCTALNELSLRVPPPNEQNRAWLAEMLPSELTLDALKHVDIVLVLPREFPAVPLHAAYALFDWSAVDGTLSRVRFPRLERVTLSFESSAAEDLDLSGLKDLAVQLLPTLHRTGLLRVRRAC